MCNCITHKVTGNLPFFICSAISFVCVLWKDSNRLVSGLWWRRELNYNFHQLFIITDFWMNLYCSEDISIYSTELKFYEWFLCVGTGSLQTTTKSVQDISCKYENVHVFMISRRVERIYVAKTYRWNLSFAFQATLLPDFIATHTQRAPKNCQIASLKHSMYAQLRAFDCRRTHKRWRTSKFML